MIRDVGFLDLARFTATFVRTYADKLKDDSNYHGVQTLLLRSATSDGAILKEWKSAKAALARIKNDAAPFLNGKPAVLGKAMVVSLRPSSFTPWEQSDDPYSLNHFRLHICMIPSALAVVYSGAVSMSLPVGRVHIVDQQALHSEVNFGTTARVHLVVDVKRPDED